MKVGDEKKYAAKYVGHCVFACLYARVFVSIHKLKKVCCLYVGLCVFAFLHMCVFESVHKLKKRCSAKYVCHCVFAFLHMCVFEGMHNQLVMNQNDARIFNSAAANAKFVDLF